MSGRLVRVCLAVAGGVGLPVGVLLAGQLPEAAALLVWRGLLLAGVAVWLAVLVSAALDTPARRRR